MVVYVAPEIVYGSVFLDPRQCETPYLSPDITKPPQKGVSGGRVYAGKMRLFCKHPFLNDFIGFQPLFRPDTVWIEMRPCHETMRHNEVAFRWTIRNLSDPNIYLTWTSRNLFAGPQVPSCLV